MSKYVTEILNSTVRNFHGKRIKGGKDRVGK